MSLEERVTNIVVEMLEIDREKVVPDALFTDDLGADSLTIVELGMAMEEEFDIEIPDEDIEQIQTVSNAVAYIKTKIEE